jgi:hypothetical protein
MVGEIEIPEWIADWIGEDDAVLVKKHDWDALVDAIKEIEKTSKGTFPAEVLDFDILPFDIATDDEVFA